MMDFDSLCFRYPWRDYQERVLTAIDDHLDDGRLHIVAAPGAGKTTLGLEVFRRLGKKALVLSPTRVIRDQWVERLGDFLSDGLSEIPSWVSKDIREPAVLTSVTYQALLSGVRAGDAEAEALEEENPRAVNDGEIQDLITNLKSHDVTVIMLDEAHHLRAEWWKAVGRVCRAIPEMILVSLTATPPFDAKDHDWRKYESLCGPIDEEISVPELVKLGTLCPHQDFVWLMGCSPTEEERIEEYDQRVTDLCKRLAEDTTFEAAVLAHPWLAGTFDENDVLREPELAMALLSFARTCGALLPKGLRHVLDLTPDDIPELGRYRWEILLAGVFFSPSFTHSPSVVDYLEDLQKQMKATELLKGRELALTSWSRLERSLALSPSKIVGCVEIHQLETEVRGEQLRQVVLTDFIRDEDLNLKIESGHLTLGAWPVFRELVLNSPTPDLIAMLTGRLTVIPEPCLPALFRYVSEEHCEVTQMGELQGMVHIDAPLPLLIQGLTALLKEGTIRVLVGTRTLLGEGWDAPAVNSLVLATAVGSFMLTNQMRGRAIRIDQAQPDKRSSIWHLAVIDTTRESGMSDMRTLERRFDTFVGLAHDRASIESGYARLDAGPVGAFPGTMRMLSMLEEHNREMADRLRAMDTLGSRWRDATCVNAHARVVPSVTCRAPERLRRFCVTRALGGLATKVSVGVAAVHGLMFAMAPEVLLSGLGTALMAVGVGALFGLLIRPRSSWKLIQMLRFHYPSTGSLLRMGETLREAMQELGMLDGNPEMCEVRVDTLRDGRYGVALTGATFYASSVFADCMREMVSPIENPRYLLTRRGHLLGAGRLDFHAVPLRFAVNKEHAQVFARAWNRYLGESELIYTRSPAGRKMLLKGRMRAFSRYDGLAAKRQDRWTG